MSNKKLPPCGSLETKQIPGGLGQYRRRADKIGKNVTHHKHIVAYLQKLSTVLINNH